MAHAPDDFGSHEYIIWPSAYGLDNALPTLTLWGLHYFAANLTL